MGFFRNLQKKTGKSLNADDYSNNRVYTFNVITRNDDTVFIKFFDGKTENDMKDYLVTGKELKKKARHPIGLIATVAEAALAVDDIGNPSVKRAVERLWNTPMREGKRRYYDNCLYFFAILALSGHYQNFI